MTYTAPSHRELLAKVPLFSGLSSGSLEQLTRQAQPLRYRMGQPLLRRETLPHQVMVILEGYVRLLGYLPGTQQPFPLARLGPGDVVGWVGLIRGVACETATASSDGEVLCLVIPAHVFLDLLKQDPGLRQRLEQQVADIELCEILGQEFQRHPQAAVKFRDLLPQVSPHAITCYLTPNANPANQLPPQADRYAWWISSSRSFQGVPTGGQIKVETLQEARSPSYPLRLLGIPKQVLNDALVDSAPPPPDSSGLARLEPQAGPLALRDDQGRANASLAPDHIPELDPRYARAFVEEDPRQQSFPYIRGRGVQGSALACFQMLARHLRMPFRRDVIDRVLSEQLGRGGELSLLFCGAVTELMGLKTQHATVPASAVSRLQAPALIPWKGSFAVLYAASSHEIVLGVPEQGILKFKPEDMAAQWTNPGEILLLQTTKSTPQEKFGIQWFLPILSKHRRVLLEVLLASFFVQLFTLANPLMIQVIIDRVITQNSTDTLQVLGIFLVVIAVFEGLLTYLRTSLFVDTTNRIDLTLGSEIIDHLLRLPLRYFERRPVGELSSRVNELENIRQFLTGTALTVVLDAIFSVIYIVVMAIYSWKLTLVSLATVPIFVAITLIAAPIVRRLLRIKAEHNARTQSYLVEALSGIQTVKAQNIELKARWQWQERYSRYVSAGFKTVQASTAASAASDFLNKLSALLVLWVGAYLVLKGDLSLGQLIAFRIISGYVTGPLLRLAQIWQNFQETALSLERLSDILDSPQEESEAERNNILMPVIQGKVNYENISFRFKDSGPLQLMNVNLEIPAGTFVGIVGQSGSGKSTLTKLLARLYEPASGRILVDDYDVNKVELYSLRRQIGIVPQDSLLFEGTIQENIALTRPEASSETIVEAAQIACAHDFIMEMPQAYNSAVGERGSSLSGGQRQRIAIARTILQNPRFLVLDEATSALDYDTERQVCLNLKAYFKGRTVFFITHRLSTIQTADLIVVMDKGAIVEQGTHTELMAMRGRYYCLYQQQDKGA